MSAPPQITNIVDPNQLQIQVLVSLATLVKPGNHSGLSRNEILQMILSGIPQLVELMRHGKLNDAQGQALVLLMTWRQRAQVTAAQVQAQAQAQAQAQTQQSQQVSTSAQNMAAAAQAKQQATAAQQASTPSTSALKRKTAADDLPISAANSNQTYTSPAIVTTNPGPQAWPNTSVSGRPTLTGGLPAGRMSGTPSQLERLPEDLSMYGLGEGRVGPRKMTPADQSMRRTIQDLVSSIDPNVKVEADVEDLLLDIADEFIDSVTNFGCRLAKHRKGDTLEVRDLQLHLERNHNIRIPGFASDETRLSISQSGTGGTGAPAKKATQGTHMTLRSARLAAVQQAKKDGKFI